MEDALQNRALVGASQHDESGPAAAEACKSAGIMGLAEGHQPHLLDAIELGRAAWDKVSQEIVMRYVYLFFLCCVGGRY